MSIKFTSPFKSREENLLYAILSQIYVGTGLGFERILIDSDFAFTLSPPEGAERALIVLETDGQEINPTRAVRFRVDAGTPTQTEGISLGNGGSFQVLNATNLSNFKVVRVDSSTNHSLMVQYFG